MSVRNEKELDELRKNEKLQGNNKDKLELCPYCSIYCNFDKNNYCLSCGIKGEWKNMNDEFEKIARELEKNLENRQSHLLIKLKAELLRHDLEKALNNLDKLIEKKWKKPLIV